MAGLGTILITRGTAPAMIAKARGRLCQWCNATALKGKAWCKRHGPGRTVDRRKLTPEAAARQVRYSATILREVWAERLLPPAFLAWPAVQRVLAQPRHARPVPLSRIVSAGLGVASGDYEPWAECIGALLVAGLLLATDSPLGRVAYVEAA